MGKSSFFGDGNIHRESTLVLYSASTRLTDGGRIMVRTAAFVLGSQMTTSDPMSTLCIVSPEGIFISSRFAGGHLHPMAGLQRIKCSSTAFSSACRHRLRQHRIWLSAIPFPLAYSSGFIHTQICCLSFSVSLFSGISPSLGLMYSRRYPS